MNRDLRRSAPGWRRLKRVLALFAPCLLACTTARAQIASGITPLIEPIKTVERLVRFGCVDLLPALKKARPITDFMEGETRHRVYRIGRIEIGTQSQQKEIIDFTMTAGGDIRRLRILDPNDASREGFTARFGPGERNPDGSYLYQSLSFESAEVKVLFERSGIKQIDWSCG
jgi:hypothetical protein